MDKTSSKYEKIITINDISNGVINKCVILLLNFMHAHNETNKKYTEYFSLRLKDSEKSPHSKDLKLEWVTLD